MNDFLIEFQDCSLEEASRRYTKYYAKTFYFASYILPQAKREAAYTIYAFCRYADNLFDDQEKYSLQEAFQKRDQLIEILDLIYKGEPIPQSFTALAGVIKQYKIPKDPFMELLKGVSMDSEIAQYGNWAELELYCYRVAAVVGLIMSYVFGVSDHKAHEQAVALGKAMQLTNILRDVTEDYERGRIYLPQDEMQYYQVNEDRIKKKINDDIWKDFMRFQIERARNFYRQADSGIPYLN